MSKLPDRNKVTQAMNNLSEALAIMSEVYAVLPDAEARKNPVENAEINSKPAPNKVFVKPIEGPAGKLESADPIKIELGFDGTRVFKDTRTNKRWIEGSRGKKPGWVKEYLESHPEAQEPPF